MQFFKFYEVGKYVSMMNISWGGVVNVANSDAITHLPRTLQDLLERLTDQFALLQRNDIQRGQEAATADLRSRGLIFNNADVGAFKAAIRSAGLYKDWREHYGQEGWAALEKSVGTLA